jgi:hypothetical protein
MASAFASFQAISSVPTLRPRSFSRTFQDLLAELLAAVLQRRRVVRIAESGVVLEADCDRSPDAAASSNAISHDAVPQQGECVIT